MSSFRILLDRILNLLVVEEVFVGEVFIHIEGIVRASFPCCDWLKLTRSIHCSFKKHWITIDSNLRTLDHRVPGAVIGVCQHQSGPVNFLFNSVSKLAQSWNRVHCQFVCFMIFLPSVWTRKIHLLGRQACKKFLLIDLPDFEMVGVRFW